MLTTNTIEQALERAGGAHGNKGYDAAVVAIEMANLARQSSESAEAMSVRRKGARARAAGRSTSST